MTPAEPPRRPKPITREHAEKVAKIHHEFWTELSREAKPDMTHAFPEWDDVHTDARERLIDAAYKLLDNGWVIDLDSDETHAVVECLMESGVTMDEANAAPVLPQFKRTLVGAFGKLAFANGRHYGLTNFDMGIEEDS